MKAMPRSLQVRADFEIDTNPVEASLAREALYGNKITLSPLP